MCMQIYNIIFSLQNGCLYFCGIPTKGLYKSLFIGDFQTTHSLCEPLALRLSWFRHNEQKMGTDLIGTIKVTIFKIGAGRIQQAL